MYDADAATFHENAESAPTSPPPFTQHSRTNSTNNTVAGGDYRPPPIYGDLSLGGPVSNPLNNAVPNSGNSSFTRSAPTGSGPGSACLPPYAPGSPVGGATSPLQATTVHSLTNPNLSASLAGGCFPNRHHDGTGSNTPSSTMSAAAAARRPRGPLGLKITVGGNAAAGVPNPAPVSPLVNTPPQGEDNQGVRRSQTDGKTPTAGSGNSNTVNSTSRGSTNANSTNNNNSDSGNANASGAGNEAETETEASVSTSKPTVEQAEARYQYLYEEFRKMSRVRTKLAEDAERLKRQLAAAIDEMQYYRQKTLTAAEEREAIVHDYNADVHYLLCLVDALASDVLAAHRQHTSGAVVNTGDKPAPGMVPSTPQNAIDVAASRLATLQLHRPAFAAATPLDGGAENDDVLNLTAPSETRGLAEHLGLHHGMWMSRISKATSEVLTEDERAGAGYDANEQGSSSPASAPPPTALTPAQQQVLLRDEMRDVQRNTHAAVNSYMTSLDYGSAPIAMQRGFVTRPQGVRNMSNERFSQRRFNSEYRGLHLHVDVPRFYAQSVPDGPFGVDVGIGQGKDGSSSVHSSPGPLYMSQRPRLNPETR